MDKAKLIALLQLLPDDIPLDFKFNFDVERVADFLYTKIDKDGFPVPKSKSHLESVITIKIHSRHNPSDMASACLEQAVPFEINFTIGSF